MLFQIANKRYQIICQYLFGFEPLLLTHHQLLASYPNGRNDYKKKNNIYTWWFIDVTKLAA